MNRVERWAEMLRDRGVDVPCGACRGLGIRWYPSTSTWRGGMGGAAMTRDVCDACWGTGDAERHGVDLRAITVERMHLPPWWTVR